MVKMTKIDPILAIKDVNRSSKWYQSVFGCKRTHGGDKFAVLVDDDSEVLICLHRWGEHEHPTMMDSTIPSGNRLILYFRTDDMNLIRKNVKKMEYPVQEEIHINPNSNQMEFSVRDPDGYYLTVTEFHKYEG